MKPQPETSSYAFLNAKAIEIRSLISSAIEKCFDFLSLDKPEMSAYLILELLKGIENETLFKSGAREMLKAFNFFEAYNAKCKEHCAADLVDKEFSPSLFASTPSENLNITLATLAEVQNPKNFLLNLSDQISPQGRLIAYDLQIGTLNGVSYDAFHQNGSVFCREDVRAITDYLHYGVILSNPNTGVFTRTPQDWNHNLPHCELFDEVGFSISKLTNSTKEVNGIPLVINVYEYRKKGSTD